jgi:hypothetical protein
VGFEYGFDFEFRGSQVLHKTKQFKVGIIKIVFPIVGYKGLEFKRNAYLK